MSLRPLPRLAPLALLVTAVLALPFARPTFAEDAAPAAPAPAPAAPVDLSTSAGKSSSDDAAKELSDTQDKLTTALHSYSLLQDENTQLKADADKAAADKSALTAQLDDANRQIAALKVQASTATQVDGLRDQLRQFQNEVASLATENAGLRTRLALAGGSPGTTGTAPTRPGAMADATPLNPVPLATPNATSGPAGPRETAPAKAEAPKTYTVVAGDSLTKISKKVYGTANRWGDILAANRKIIKNENNVPLGATLTIP